MDRGLEPSGIGRLAPEWDALADRTGAPPFLRPGWITAWWHAFGRGTLDLITVRDDGRLAGVLPVVRAFGEVRSPTNWHTPLFGILAEKEAAARSIAETLFAGNPRHVSMSFLDRGDAGLPALTGRALRGGYRILILTLMRSPYVSTDGSWEVYLRRLGRPRVKEVARSRRRLAEHGHVEFEVEEGFDGGRLGPLLGEAFQVEASGWKGREGTAIDSRPQTRRFYQEIAAWAAERGWLRLSFLRVARRPVAFEYAIEQGDLHYPLKAGFNPAFARFGPGMILQYDVLARAFSTHLLSYELLGQDEGWKRRWATGSRDRLRVQSFAPSVGGYLEWAAHAHAEPLAKRLKASSLVAMKQARRRRKS